MREMYNCCNDGEFEWAANVLKRYPTRLRAFEHMLCMCVDQLRVEFNMTPKYLNSSTCSRGWPSSCRLSSGNYKVISMCSPLHPLCNNTNNVHV